jgi:uncharacterized coiled-coil DUF342 family protein
MDEQRLSELNKKVQELAVEIRNLNVAVEEMLEQIQWHQSGAAESSSGSRTHLQSGLLARRRG